MKFIILVLILINKHMLNKIHLSGTKSKGLGIASLILKTSKDKLDLLTDKTNNMSPGFRHMME